MMMSPKFSTWRQTKGDDPGLLFSSLLRLEMTFSHSTLGAAFLNDEKAHELKKKKWQPARFACSLEVKRLKTGVLQLKDLPEKAQNI